MAELQELRDRLERLKGDLRGAEGMTPGIFGCRMIELAALQIALCERMLSPTNGKS